MALLKKKTRMRKTSERLRICPCSTLHECEDRGSEADNLVTAVAFFISSNDSNLCFFSGKELPADFPRKQIHAVDSLGRGPLHYAACSNDVMAAADLIENGVNASLQDSRGMSPLHYAVMHQSYEVLETLLESGANTNAQNSSGDTSLILSVGDERALTLLIQFGANLNVGNSEGATALHIAAANGEIESIRILISSGAFLNSPDNCGDTPLHYAVREESIAAANALLESSLINSKTPNEDGESAKDLALIVGNNDILEAFGVNESK